MPLLPSVFLQRVRDSGDRDAFGQRAAGGWRWTSWGETGERSMAVAAALLATGLRPGDTVGILAGSRREWVEIEMAALLCGGVVVPIHPATTGPAARDIARRAALRIAFAEDPLQAEKLLPALEPGGPLTRLVVLESLSRLPGADAQGRLEIALTDLAAGSASILPFDDVVDLGRHEVRRGGGSGVERRVEALRPEDPATIVFNWSAAGRPLASVLTHDNLAFTTTTLPRELEVTAQDRTLLFLPLAHVYPRLLVWTGIQVGYGLGLVSTPGEALRAAAEMRPDFLAVVPRFLERLRRGLDEEAAKGPVWWRHGVRWALGAGRRRNEAAARGDVPLLVDLEHRLADRIVHRSLRERFGGRLRFLICGGAPLDPDTARYFADVGMPVYEGYGMTEGTALTTFNRPSRSRPGTVGTAATGVELRLAPDGEILFRGRNVMRGYLDDDAATAEVIDADGWAHSGDLGRLDADGFLTITGRKKDVIVTEGGKNVSPLHLETLLRESPVIRDALVVGDRRIHLVALLVLDPREISKTALLEGIILTGPDEAADHPAIRALLDDAVAQVNARLDHFLRIRAYAAVPDLGPPDQPARARRAAAEKRYREVIEGLYGRG